MNDVLVSVACAAQSPASSAYIDFDVRASRTAPNTSLSIALQRRGRQGLMKLTFFKRPWIYYSLLHQGQLTSRRFSSGKAHEALRILFCGSDSFSCASLRALHDKHRERPNLISAIDVVCRPGKRTGRGLKTIREVPIKAVAQDLKLPIHEIDTFTGWTPPPSLNLIIAVSFGLLVPARILKAAKYGGLNVHPSLLPDFRGAAPLHHTLLAGRRKTGVTVQTLHPSKFDHGQIVAQTPRGSEGEDGSIEMTDPDSCTVQQLEDTLAPIGAAMLAQVIEDGTFIPPVDEGLTDAGKQREISLGPAPMAPKIKTEDRHVQWATWDARQILRRQRVLGPLWSVADAEGRSAEQEATVRVLLNGIRTSETVPSGKAATSLMGEPGTPFLWYVRQGSAESNSPRLGVWTSDRHLLEIERITVEGQPPADAAHAVTKARLVSGSGSQNGVEIQRAPRPWH